MKISVILGHPTPGSFNHAVAKTVVETLCASGHNVIFHDLYAENFDPILRTPEIPRGTPAPAQIVRHTAEILSAEGIVIVHPNWWCQPPAILKGWVDRVLRAGEAYRFTEKGAVGLLKARQALVITTANNSQENEVQMYGDPLEVFWKKVVFGLCGVPCERLIFSPVILSTPDQRAQWLQQVGGRVNALFARRHS
jgi:putative NADPH-quinone reductase